MATQEPPENSLPVFYGQQMQDDTVVQRPSHQGSRDALLRLPIQQPNEAHTPNRQIANPEVASSPITPADALGVNSYNPSRLSTNRVSGDPGRYSSYPLGERGEIDPDRSYPSPNHQRNRSRYDHQNHVASFENEFVEEEDQPRPYRRPNRRYTRPPPAHQNQQYRDPWARGQPRGSYDGAAYGFEHEPDTPTKPRQYYHYGSEDEDMRRNGFYPYSGGAGGRGPPRRPPSTDEVFRLPWLMWMNSNAKNHFVAFIGEFVGTTMFLFFAFSGTQVANIGSSDPSDSNTTTGADTGFSPETLLYIALVFSFSLMVNVWIFFRISGGLFNPAVTFAMLLTRTLTPIRCVLLLVAQVAGAIFSSFIVSVLFPTPFNVRTTLSADTSLARGVFIEAVLTAELVFTIFMLAKEKHKATFIAPVGIGLVLFIAELVGVYYTGGSLNPARSFGPCVITGVFDQEHWIYWVGPGIGAILAVTFYKFIKILEYEMANPGQDADRDKAGQEEKGPM